MIPIENFISNFKKGFDKKTIEDIFLNGNCYHFALILQGMYDGEIVYDHNGQHFLFLYDEEVYDITGEVEWGDGFEIWEELEDRDYEEFHQIERDCVYKI